MKYMGSKRRIAKYILPIMLAERRTGQWWVEPFVGGGNIIERVTGKRLGADINPYVIQALISIRDCVHELPKNNSEFTETDYKRLRESDDYKHKGYAGFAFSYGGRWLNGWSRNKKKRDYVAEAYKSALRQSPLLQDVELVCCDYEKLAIPANSLIYCDPPYNNTKGYNNKFDHDKFWEWCRGKAKEGHTVFVSEYNAPDDFKCIWQSRKIVSSLTTKTGGKRAVERLFKYEEI